MADTGRKKRFAVGTVLRFIDPQPEEVGLRFVVLEDREERVLVTTAEDLVAGAKQEESFTIRPTWAYRTEDMEAIEGPITIADLEAEIAR